jgi:cytochrome c-type biogenesis protein CcmH
MNSFVFAAAGLVLVTLLVLLRPWQRRRTEPESGVREINAGVYRDQIAELDRDLASGTLAHADHAQAREELQRRLLADIALPVTSAAPGSGAGRSAIVIAIALPLAAAGLYGALGSPEALSPQVAQAAQHDVTQDQIEQMVGALAARLEKNPSDLKGWAMLARSYHAMGRTEQAVAAFARLGDTVQKDPVLLADYADVLATQANGNLAGKPLQLVKTALRLDPDNAMALSLAATAAYNRKDFAEAAVHWQHLKDLLPPDSGDAKFIAKMLVEIGAPATDATVATVASVAATTPPAAAGTKAISGIVSLSPALQAQVRDTDPVFVFARAVEGSRAPLAVQRAKVSDLPLRFRLDDSMSMSPQNKLSDAKSLRIEARVSRDGTATPAAGDLIGASGTVAVGDERVALVIDRMRQ